MSTHLAHIASLLLLLSAPAFAQGLSIRGLRIGATVTELQEAGWIESTFAKLIKKPFVEGADTVMIQLKGTPSTFSKPIDRSLGGDTGIGCSTIDGTLHAFWPGHAFVYFRDGFAEHITVASAVYMVHSPRVPDNVASYLQALYDNVRDQLGEPIGGYRPITAGTPLTSGSVLRDIVLARWKQGSFDARLEFSYSPGDNFEWVHVQLIFSDTVSAKGIPKLSAH